MLETALIEVHIFSHIGTYIKPKRGGSKPESSASQIDDDMLFRWKESGVAVLFDAGVLTGDAALGQRSMKCCACQCRLPDVSSCSMFGVHRTIFADSLLVNAFVAWVDLCGEYQ
jgi:hypothetical protein